MYKLATLTALVVCIALSPAMAQKHRASPAGQLYQDEQLLERDTAAYEKYKADMDVHLKARKDALELRKKRLGETEPLDQAREKQDLEEKNKRDDITRKHEKEDLDRRHMIEKNELKAPAAKPDDPYGRK